eukprot:TRINITY_DN14363_c0_g3_i2.p1 TRINITY_DN14363_c0_g3~~TRINITY_DN14363_c0_g3_i2.p1  ORF type:complete len:154 (+),score=17.00 TRINITY_DN14363_c0_g3_i2:58-519(+)
MCIRDRYSETLGCSRGRSEAGLCRSGKELAGAKRRVRRAVILRLNSGFKRACSVGVKEISERPPIIIRRFGKRHKKNTQLLFDAKINSEPLSAVRAHFKSDYELKKEHKPGRASKYSKGKMHLKTSISTDSYTQTDNNVNHFIRISIKCKNTT